MRNLKKLYSKTNNIFLLLLFLIIFNACAKEKKAEKYYAKVGNEYLTEDMLKDFISSERYKNLYKSEIIRRWIENEVLYQEAVKKGIEKDKEYKKLVDRASRELAIALLKKEIIQEVKNSFSSSELEQFYEKYKEDFRLQDEAYKLNIITFNNEDSAIKFRTLLLESDWDRILPAYKNDSTVVNLETRKFVYSHDVYPVSILRILQDMLPLEVSVVIPEEHSSFTVVQLIEKYPKNFLPSFESIKNVVEERYLAFKQKEHLEKYISDLIGNYKTEIEWYTE
ncbi:peptidyl-prolyl cis-trans isomerase [Melioribacteraceae bacterium 4301-Me]|uniref:peptidylprolyl isomerase n=1 Tax=Pyranulibacter aquaticus TaxID=3163344 RepID=UPI00359964B1